ncbi:hypothetical protein Q5H93_08440 [Hymenobacter sp. ASUV-10]|uniref:Uncharacterized protein n=1 Tax=Hymenobacter aranciens TaxID=3063996 RepID=A0ABT9B989_9BACT|nr:hypothetical protein [Hymenobacter sp. ASUV-10]MDO7874758.1 hypothetical protein [Hymenobacter sp. ASUV-10]
MSYLNGLRLHFAGRFQAAPSTVNNDITHFNNATFKPSYQQPQDASGPNGWWNPGGGAEWRLLGCTVTGAWMGGGQAANGDPILGCVVADSDRRAPAKIVDLDPQQQMVSQIWGLEVRICTAAGALLLRGQYEPTGFTDIWDRSHNGGGDSGASSMYQSVLTNLEWGDLRASPFMQALQATAAGPDGRLSIKFNVDGYNMNPTSPEFTRGRIVGTIGPATVDEPKHFVPGRQFVPEAALGSGFFTPTTGLGFCVAQVDTADSCIYLDLGNAVPTTVPGGPMLNQGQLQLVAWVQPDNQNPFFQNIGDPIDYMSPDWYARTAGVVMLPATRALTADELSAVQNNQLGLLLTNGNTRQLTPESPQGLYVRADTFVFRLDAGQTATLDLWATQFGQPLPAAQGPILLQLDPSQLQGGPGEPAVATPTTALTFPAQVQTDANGRATVQVQANDLSSPRDYIDGQVYGLRASLPAIGYDLTDYPLGQWNFVSLLVFDPYTPKEPVTWYDDLQPIFQQYANLYPIMSRFLNLADPQAVWANRELLLMAFGLPITDANTMPVTRDLSGPKRAAILRWLGQSELQMGQPPMTEPQPQALAETAAPTVAGPPAAAPAGAPTGAPRGGKTAAAARRLVLQKP